MRSPTERRVRAWRRTAPLAVLLAGVACGDGGTGAAGPEILEPDTVPVYTALPARLDDLRTESAVAFAPAWPAWTNGLGASRTILLPTGRTVDVSGGAWTFPEGTVLLQTLSRSGSGVPVETRALLRKEGTWIPGVYVWNETITEAALVDGSQRVPIVVTGADGRAFEHVVPSAADCLQCHGATPNFVLGFTAFQLAGTEEGPAQLQRLAEAGVLSGVPTQRPATIAADDEETEWALGYVTGNCVHCHHAGSATVDLGHEVFMSSVVGGTGPSGAPLVVAGDADRSAVYTRLRDRSMPPVGVQAVDAGAVARLGAWIDDLGG